MASLTSLPFELLLEILEDCEVSLDMMLVHSRFRDALEPRYYYQAEWNWYSDGSGMKVHLFLRTLLGRPDLAAHVCEFRATGSKSICDPSLLDEFTVAELSKLMLLEEWDGIQTGSYEAFCAAAIRLSNPWSVDFDAEGLVYIPRMLNVHKHECGMENLSCSLRQPTVQDFDQVDLSVPHTARPSAGHMAFPSIRDLTLDILISSDDPNFASTLTLDEITFSIHVPRLVRFIFKFQDRRPERLFLMDSLNQFLEGCQDTLEWLEISILFSDYETWYPDGAVDEPISLHSLHKLRYLRIPSDGLAMPLDVAIPPSVDELHISQYPPSIKGLGSEAEIIAGLSSCMNKGLKYISLGHFDEIEEDINTAIEASMPSDTLVDYRYMEQWMETYIWKDGYLPYHTVESFQCKFDRGRHPKRTRPAFELP